MEWISVKEKMPKIGDVVTIYGVLHAFRENYSKGSIKKTVQHDVTYEGLKSINGEKKAHWFGGWRVDDENECITHWLNIRPLPSAQAFIFYYLNNVL